MPSGFFNWVGTFWKLPDAYALQHQSLDAYLFLRFLRVCTTICFVSLLITWPVLFPVNATGGGGQSELEILSYSNIDIEKQKNRLYAHTFIGWVVYGFTMYMVVRECIFYINLRQAFLLSPQYAKRIAARTVLFTSVPDDYLDETRIRRIFSDSVKHVWIAGDTKKLDEIVEERDKVAMKLEKAEIKLLRTVNKERIKAAKKSGGSAGADEAAAHDAEHGSVAARWITNKQRPTHRLGPLGLIGKKVDSIEWGRTELHRLVPQTEAAQLEYKSGKYNKVNAVFVEFHTQSDAQAAFQTVTHHHALQMAPKYIGVKPQEVVWKSLSIPWWQLVIRRYAVYAFIGALVIFWAIPVGIVGIIAQVKTLEKLPGLTWISSIPSVSTPHDPCSEQILTIQTDHSRCRFRSSALGRAVHPHVARPRHHACLRQGRRRHVPLSGRALHAERLLLLPGRAGLPDPHHHRHRVDGHCADRGRSYPGLLGPVDSAADLVQLLHLVLYRPRSDHCNRSPYAGRRYDRLQDSVQVPRQDAACHVHQVDFALGHPVGQPAAGLHQHCCHQ